MPELGHKPGVGQRSHGTQILNVDDDSLLGLSIAQVGHDTVLTGWGVLHGTTIAIDDEGI